jgi:hypothetical protein
MASGHPAGGEHVHPDVSVADLAERDLDDPTTPSHRTADGEPAEGSFDLPLEELGEEPDDAG